MTKRYRTHSVCIILLVSFLIAFVGIFNYLIDPFQVYSHKRLLVPKNQRDRLAGWIHNHIQEGDAVIIGTSLSENFLPSTVSQALGWEKTYNLTISASRIREQLVVLNAAFAKGVKNVLWELRPLSFIPDDRLDAWHPTQQMPVYLYTPSPFDDYRYLLSLDVLSDALTIAGNDIPTGYGVLNFEKQSYWMTQNIDKYLRFNRRSNFNKRMRKMNGDMRFENTIVKNEKRPRFERYILGTVRNHPDVNFIFYFPPMLRQGLYAKGREKIIAYLSTLSDIVDYLSTSSNVQLFGFDDADIIVANSANYKDAEHFHSGVNLWILEQIGRGQHRLEQKSMADYIDRILVGLSQRKMHLAYTEMIPLAFDSEQKRVIESIKTN